MNHATTGTRRLIVGIDIGGTKTHLRATPSDGALIVPSPSWRTRDWDKDAEGLVALVDKLRDGTPVSAIGIGAHGCDDAAECNALENALGGAALDGCFVAKAPLCAHPCLDQSNVSIHLLEFILH